MLRGRSIDTGERRGRVTASGSTGARSIAACASWRSSAAPIEITKRRSSCAARIASKIWRELGKSTLLQYLEEVLGYGPRAAQDRVRVALALEDLPELADALATGELAYSAIRELTRVATPMTDHEWRQDAQGKNLRQIEQGVAGRKKGRSADRSGGSGSAPAHAALRSPAGDACTVAPGAAGARDQARHATRRRPADRGALHCGARRRGIERRSRGGRSTRS